MSLIDQKFILASGSAARQSMLKDAGLSFDVHPADIDERQISDNLLSTNARASDIALKLAEEKAIAVSKQKPDQIVIGSDQVLELDGTILNKAASKDDALNKLKTMRGKTHCLISAVAVVKGGTVLWSTTDQVSLYMRDLSDDDLVRYADRAGDALTSCVGAYQIEGLGAWLFSKVEGDYFTIMGMPLLPLLGYLYDEYAEKKDS